MRDLDGKAALRALATVGASDRRSWVVGTLFVLATGLFIDSLKNKILSILGEWAIPFSLVFYAVLAGFLFFLIRRQAERMSARVHEERVAPKLDTLILFLSLADMKNPEAEAGKVAALANLTPQTLDQVKNSWRMPLEAIAWHLPALSRVILIVSADSTDSRTGATIPGTWRFTTQFTDAARRLAAGRSLTIVTAQQFLGGGRASAHGVDFEDATRLERVVTGIYRRLRATGTKEAEVILDLTGGQKTTTAIGAAAAVLVPGRRFQYVSTHNYRVRAFDVTYDLLDVPGAA